MSGGIGRGRGWLKLKPQIPPGSEKLTDSVSHSDVPNSQEFSDLASNDFTNLIDIIKQLNLNDDGIKFNQKIRYIIEIWTEECQDSLEVEKSFNSIHKACLLDPDLASKLVYLISSRTFLSQEIHDQNIRLMFLRKLQDDFEGCPILQSSNPNHFRNCVQLMGEFFNKARLANGQPFMFMATPLISYMEMLLNDPASQDLKLFTIQLYMNFNALREECPEKMALLIAKVRYMLVLDKKYSKECKLWLMLAIEIASCRNAFIPADIHRFYREELGDQAMNNFQADPGLLTVETLHVSKTLDDYKSDVNVLQISNDPSVDQEPLHNHSSEVNYSDSGFQTDNNSMNSAPSMKEQSSQKGGRSGRPILGVGARLQKNPVSNKESSDINWESNWDAGKTHNQNNHDSCSKDAGRTHNQNKPESGSKDAGRTHYQNKPESGSKDAGRTRNQNKPDSGSRDADNAQNQNKSQNQKKFQNKSDSGNRTNKNRQRDGKSDNGQREKGSNRTRNDQRKIPQKNKKGWEHDDRFETEYH